MSCSRRQSKRPALRTTHAWTGAPVRLLVMTPDEKTAAWARRPIPITDSEQARRTPELAVLSTLMHGGEERVLEQLDLTFDACQLLAEPLAGAYIDAILAVLSEAHRASWEKRMQGQKYQSEFASR